MGPGKALYQAGDTLEATLLSSLSKTTFFIDIIKDKQTVITQTIDVENGVGQLAIDLPPSLFGVLVPASGSTPAPKSVPLINLPLRSGRWNVSPSLLP